MKSIPGWFFSKYTGPPVRQSVATAHSFWGEE